LRQSGDGLAVSIHGVQEQALLLVVVVELPRLSEVLAHRLHPPSEPAHRVEHPRLLEVAQDLMAIVQRRDISHRRMEERRQLVLLAAGRHRQPVGGLPDDPVCPHGWIVGSYRADHELDAEYFQIIDAHLKELRFRRGVLISARLGKGNKGVDYVLRMPEEQGWMQRLPIGTRSGYTFAIADRDESGLKALGELQGRGINLVASAAAQSADHILGFFTMLSAELGFHVGALNLRDRLAENGHATSFPVPLDPGEPELFARDLQEPCLALTIDGKVEGHDVEAEGKSLVMITGANQGGKSTFLRSVGLAQLMMQGCLFVAAESFRANVCGAVFTHYSREEDATMESGKLDEELSRMSDIADRIAPHCLLLCNESFAATNEREDRRSRSRNPSTDRIRRQGPVRHSPVRPGARVLPPRVRHGTLSARRAGARREPHVSAARG
jgi:MutS domain V